MDSSAIIFRSILLWAVGVALTLLCPLVIAFAYSTVACPNSDPVGWAFVTLLGVGLQFPLVAVVLVLTAAFFWPTVNALLGEPEPMKVVAWCAIAICFLGIASWAISLAIGATARCSLLW